MEKEIIFPFDLKGRKAMYFIGEIQDKIHNAVFFEKDNRKVNAKSLLGILSLGVEKGEKIKVLCVDESEYDILEKVIDDIDSEVM